MAVRSKSYCIKIPPIAWQRARLNGQRFFDGQTKEKVAFGLYLNQQHNDESLFSNPITLDVVFYMAQPKSLKDRKGTMYHSTKPDLDNLIKFLLDSIKDVLIVDDKIICSIYAKKVYDKEPRTEFVITEVL